VAIACRHVSFEVRDRATAIGLCLSTDHPPPVQPTDLEPRPASPRESVALWDGGLSRSGEPLPKPGLVRAFFSVLATCMTTNDRR
jgi:hypothetical protein